MNYQVKMEDVSGFSFGNPNNWANRLRNTVQEEEEDSLSKVKKLDGEINYMQYEPSYVGKDAGEFVRVQTKTRLNLLKAMKERKEGVDTLRKNTHSSMNQIITINTNYYRNKKRNYYYRNHKRTPQIKTKFELVAQVKSEWKEVKRLDFIEKKKLKVRVDTSVLQQQTQDSRTFVQKMLKVTHKNKFMIRDVFEGSEPPHDVRNDDYLMNLYQTEKIPEGKTGIFISELALYSLCSISKSMFPFVLKTQKKGNKLLISFDVTIENCFAFFESYRESTSENYIENEMEIQQLSLDSTRLSEAFQYSSINPPTKMDEGVNSKTEKEKFEKLKKEFEGKMFNKNKNFRHLKIELDSDVIIYTRIGLEGTDKAGKEILVRALYDTPSLLSKKNKQSDVFQDCIQYNNYRITKWMTQAYFAGKHIY